MATFFGEVIIPSSRAFFDDFDDTDEDDENQTSPVTKTSQLSLKKHCDAFETEYKAFIISDGQIASGFSKIYMLKDSDKLIAEIELRDSSDDSSSDILVVTPRKTQSCKLFLLSNSCLLLQVSQGIHVGISNQLTLLLKPWLSRCKEIIVLASQHNANYRCESINDLPSAFVRALSTTAYPLPTCLKHLEQPNFISDFPASVLSWCECQEKPGLLILLYSDQTYIDSVTLNPLLKAFEDTGLSSFIVNKNPTIPNSFSNTLRNTDKSFMYM